MVITSALHDRVVSSRSTGHGHVWCKNLAPNIGNYDSDGHVNVGLVSFNWGRKGTTEDDIHPGSDHPQCQHINVI